MIKTWEFNQKRRLAFCEWKRKQYLPGLSPTTFSQIFEYVLSKQTPSGSFKAEKNSWEDVQTAVVLKALGCLGFKSNDDWDFYYSEENKRVNGSVEKALNFLLRRLSNVGPGNIVGEDIWDTCQVLLALAVFGKYQEGASHANDIHQKWQNKFQHAIDENSGERWTGPAYLSAMIEVVHFYQSYLNGPPKLKEMIENLRSLESVDATNPTGCFPASDHETNTNRWNTSLVLRTFGKMGHSQQDYQLIERISKWLLRELGENQGWVKENAEEAMFIGRALDGLNTVTSLVPPDLQKEIKQALEYKGKRLEELWLKENFSLKSCTAVCEYFSSLTFPIPAGLLLDISDGFESESINKGTPEDIQNGYRIVWLSDLHLAEQNDPIPTTVHWKIDKNFLGKWIAKLMDLKGNPLTRSFQEQNLTLMKEKIVKIRPDHILITGDLTNFAKEEQFQRVRDHLLSLQQKITGDEIYLNPKFFTVLPGNHDISDQNQAGGGLRKNLGLFFSKFSDVYNGRQNDYEQAFPLLRNLGDKNGGIKIRLVCLDSNSDFPVWVVGFNARGQIDNQQMERFRKHITNKKDLEIILVALHHHPIVVPEMCSQIEDHFLSLDEATGRILVSLCGTQKVSAILHGHFHTFSMWAGRVPQGTHEMQIIGSPSGTMNNPDQNVTFLELREAKLENRLGLALYLHQYLDDQKNWEETYQTFIGIE